MMWTKWSFSMPKPEVGRKRDAGPPMLWPVAPWPGPGLPEEIAHIIEAHSTKFSPRPPKSSEALILRHADIIVASCVYMAQGLEMEKVLKESLARIG